MQHRDAPESPRGPSQIHSTHSEPALTAGVRCRAGAIRLECASQRTLANDAFAQPISVVRPIDLNTMAGH